MYTGLRVFMSEAFFESIEFADDVASLEELIPAVSQLPTALFKLANATSEEHWDLEEYILSRCTREGIECSACAGARSYRGIRLDFTLFDRAAGTKSSLQVESWAAGP